MLCNESILVSHRNIYIAAWESKQEEEEEKQFICKNKQSKYIKYKTAVKQGIREDNIVPIKADRLSN